MLRRKGPGHRIKAQVFTATLSDQQAGKNEHLLTITGLSTGTKAEIELQQARS